MKAFLSHSSLNKNVVEAVAEDLGLANVELDSTTFDRGILNTKAIQMALNRSSIFVLFLSKGAIASPMVKLETEWAKELVGCGLIERTLIVCLDENSFESAPQEWKTYNFVRKATSVKSISRLIQSTLTVARVKTTSSTTPFVGRNRELGETKERLIDPAAPHPKGLFVSGNAGIGRRTFARKLFSDVYPSVNQIFPEISLEALDGYEEIHRKVFQVIAPIATLSAYKARILAFSIASADEKACQIAQLIETLIESRETLIIQDNGGLLEQSGRLQPHIQLILDKIQSRFHPSIIFISERTVPRIQRPNPDSVIYSQLPSLERKDVRQLAAFLFKRAKIPYSEEQLQAIVELSDGHPFNVMFVIEAAKQYTLDVFLSDPSELTHWKRSRSTAFLQKITNFTPLERSILIGLKAFSSLDFDTLAQTTDGSTQELGAAMMRLMDLHIIEAKAEAYLISPPLRIAVGRDPRFTASASELSGLLRKIGGLLNGHDENSEIPFSLLNAGILAQLEESGTVSELFVSFMLPSHLVWLARRHYDNKEFEDAIRLAKSALEGSDRLSPAGLVEACRCLCLAGTRLGEEKAYELGLSVLKRNGNSSWALSNLDFLIGFHARLQGKLPEAEKHLRKAYELSPGNFSAARELAAVCLARGDVDSAEEFAREAFSKAPDNSYILDIMLSILIKRGVAENRMEIESLFERFKYIGDEEGHSFYTTRCAEYALRSGRLDEARKLIDRAKEMTPGFFGVRELRFEIYLDVGNKAVALEELNALEALVTKSVAAERRANSRPFLEMKARYLSAIGSFKEAKQVYHTKGLFTPEEVERALKEIDMEQAYRRQN